MFATAGRALGMSRHDVKIRVKRTPHLYALYGKRKTGEDFEAPTEGDILLRRPDQMPDSPGDPQLARLVTTTEKMIRGGLEQIGAPASTIAKLRAFDGFGIGAGAFLAQSVQDMHQLYFSNLLVLDGMAADIKRRYLDEDAPEKPEAMERMFWQRAYNEIVEQIGKGHDRMLTGTQAMVAMMKAKRAEKEGTGAKMKPGW